MGGPRELLPWIDRKSGLGGCRASQILPLQDCASHPGWVDFAAAEYPTHGR